MKHDYIIKKDNIRLRPIGAEDLELVLTWRNRDSIRKWFVNQELIEFKKQNESERKKEALLPDMLSTLIKEGKMKMKIYPAVEDVYGITIPEDELTLRNIFSKL